MVRSLVLGRWSLVVGPWSLVVGRWSLASFPRTRAETLQAASLLSVLDSSRVPVTPQFCQRTRSSGGVQLHVPLGPV